VSTPTSFDSFFANIDKKLEDQQAERAQVEAEAPAKAAFIDQAIKDAALLAGSYRDALARRGITLDISTGATGIGVTMLYKNGRKRTLHVSKAISGDYLEIWTVQPNRKEADFRSTDGVPYREGNYSDAVFSDKLQKLIDDHIFEAKHHEGVR